DELPGMANFYARLWSFIQTGILEFGSALPHSQWLRIRGEDLLGNPDKHLRSVVAWLGVRSDPAAIEQMKHPENSVFAGPVEGAGAGDNDPDFLRNPVLRTVNWPDKLKPPPVWRLPKDLTSTLAEYASAY